MLKIKDLERGSPFQLLNTRTCFVDTFSMTTGVAKGADKRGREGFLTATVVAAVRPEPRAYDLTRRYKMALQYAVNWVLDRSTVVKTKRGKVKAKTPKLSEIHDALYRVLIERYGLPAKVAQDCYRNALAVAKSWLGNGARGRRPVIKSAPVWLTPEKSYRIRDNYVEIAGGIRLEILGMDRRYEGCEYKEARLVQRGGRMFLHISVRIPKPAQYESRGVVAVDVNERYIYFGNAKQIDKIETAVERAEHQRRLAERLQQKYSWPNYQAWRRRRGILSRVRHFHRRARNIVEDWARKTALAIITTAQTLQSAVAREDLTGLKEKFSEMSYEHRRRAVWMSYRKLAWWIDWQAAKRGVPVVVVDPKGTSTTCPRCGGKMEEVGHRRMRCTACGFEADRDVVAVLNIERRALSQMGGPLAAPTAPQMTDVAPNRWGEPVSRPGAT